MCGSTRMSIASRSSVRPMRGASLRVSTRASVRCASTRIACMASRDASSKRKSVREIEHTSTLQAKNSCGLICLRVKSDLKFGCSMRWSNKRRSITELNSDSHSQKLTVKNERRQHSRTLQSCGCAPSEISQRFSESSTPQLSLHASPSFLLAVGRAPALTFARLSLLCLRLARRAEFISVSGSRAARSALHSDLRLKRTSGVAAATPQLHAPMNSPDPAPTMALTLAGFPSTSMQLLEGV
jgi:hypothetical protein